MKRFLFLFLCLLLVLTGCGQNTSTSSTDNQNEQEAVESTEESDTQTLGEKMKDPEREEELNKQMNLTIGESAEVDGISVTLDEVYLTEGDDYTFEELQPDHIFMVCKLTIQNNSQDDFYPGALSNELYADNTACPNVVVNSSEEQYLTSAPEIAPGTNTSGVFAYDVPQSASSFQLKVSPSFTTSSDKKDIIFNFDTSQIS